MGEKESALPPGRRFHSNGCSTTAAIELLSFSVSCQSQRNQLPFAFKALDSTPRELFACPVGDENTVFSSCLCCTNLYVLRGTEKVLKCSEPRQVEEFTTCKRREGAEI